LRRFLPALLSLAVLTPAPSHASEAVMNYMLSPLQFEPGTKFDKHPSACQGKSDILLASSSSSLLRIGSMTMSLLPAGLDAS